MLVTSKTSPHSSLCRYVFWVDCCESPYIGRVGMDGRGQVVIIDKEIYSPTALTIDYTNKRLYWADDNHILFANMEGSQRHKGEAEYNGYISLHPLSSPAQNKLQNNGSI